MRHECNSLSFQEITTYYSFCKREHTFPITPIHRGVYCSIVREDESNQLRLGHARPIRAWLLDDLPCVEFQDVMLGPQQTTLHRVAVLVSADQQLLLMEQSPQCPLRHMQG